MSRVTTAVVFAALAAAAGAVMTGVPELALPFVGVATATALAARRAGRAPTDLPWTAPSNPPVTPSARPSGRGPSVRGQLARVESRELLLHPWFGAGIGLCVFMALAFGLSDSDGSWADELQGLAFLAHPLVGTAVLASHRIATRSSRDGTDELFRATPTSSRMRTGAVLGAAWLPPLVLALFCAAYLAARAASNADLTEPYGPVGLHVLAAMVLGAGGVALGTALGRSVRFAAAPVAAVVAVGIVSLRLAESHNGEYEPRMLLATFPPVGDDTPILTDGQMWLHLAWLAAITTITAVVAATQPAKFDGGDE